MALTVPNLPLVLKPGAGPDNPSGRRGGLWPGEVLGYQLDGRGGRGRLIQQLSVPSGTEFVLAVFPELDTASDIPWGACLIGTVAVAADVGALALSDQHGHPVLADDPGCLVADQWNLIRLDLTELAGESIRIDLVAAVGATGRGWLQLGGPRPIPAEPDDVVARVRTTRGTHSSHSFSRGNTVPASCLPHGFVQLTPITDARTDRWLYRWQEDHLQGFAFTHQPSPWIGDRNAFQLMPFLGRPTAEPGRRSMTFDHASETAQPDRYGVDLANRHGQIRAEITPTMHGGVFRFTFPQTHVHRGVVLDQPFAGELQMHTLADGRLSFHAFVEGPQGRSGDTPGAWVYGETRQAVRTSTVRDKANPLIGVRLGPIEFKDTPLGKIGLPWIRRQASALHLLEGSVLEVAATMSFIGAEQARHTFQLELGNADFDEVQSRAHTLWAADLSRLELTGGTADARATAWSNVARLLCWPSAHHENTGSADEPHWAYASPFHRDAPDTATGTGCRIVDGQLYVNNGYWDTYRTAWPALHLLFPERAGELLDGLVQQYLDSGWMSRWSAPGHIDSMVGTSSDAIFADAAAHGIAFNELAAYDSALRNASVPADRSVVGRKGISAGRFLGWIPDRVPEALSWSIENANCDAALGLWSARLAKRADALGVPQRGEEFAANADWFANRAAAVWQLFDDRVGFFQSRDADGDWRVTEPAAFDPLSWGGDYVETNAWGMAFSAVQDGATLARVHGGPDGLAARLEAALELPEPASLANKGSYWTVIHEMVEARAVRMGQFGLSNQPGHHLPFMFCHAGRPWRTQQLTREVCDRLMVGSEIGQGYLGDEDNGEMAAWQLFCQLGLYPLQLGSGELILTAPLFPDAAWTRPDGTMLRITTQGTGRYIAAVRINGQPWREVGVPVEILHRDCLIEVDLSDQATQWGAESRPLAPRSEPSCVSPFTPDQSSAATLTRLGNPSLLTGEPGISGETGETGADLAHVVDDLGERVIRFAEGEIVTITWPDPIRFRYLTLTTTGTGAREFWLEGRTNGSWLALTLTTTTPIWDDQTLSYALHGSESGLVVDALRFRWLSNVGIRQLEIY